MKNLQIGDLVVLVSHPNSYIYSIKAIDQLKSRVELLRKCAGAWLNAGFAAGRAVQKTSRREPLELHTRRVRLNRNQDV